MKLIHWTSEVNSLNEWSEFTERVKWIHWTSEANSICSPLVEFNPHGFEKFAVKSYECPPPQWRYDILRMMKVLTVKRERELRFSWNRWVRNAFPVSVPDHFPFGGCMMWCWLSIYREDGGWQGQSITDQAPLLYWWLNPRGFRGSSPRLEVENFNPGMQISLELSCTDQLSGYSFFVPLCTES